MDDGVAGTESGSETERDLPDIYGDPAGRVDRTLDRIEEYSYALKNDNSLSPNEKTDLRRRIRFLREEINGRNMGSRNGNGDGKSYYSREDK